MIELLTPFGNFELGRGADAPSITKDNIDELVDGFEKIIKDESIRTIGLADGSSLILTNGLRDNCAIRVSLDKEVTDGRLYNEVLHGDINDLVVDFLSGHPNISYANLTVTQLMCFMFGQKELPSKKE